MNSKTRSVFLLVTAGKPTFYISGNCGPCVVRRLEPRHSGEVAAPADGEGFYKRLAGERSLFLSLSYCHVQHVGANCVRPQNNPTVFSLSLESTSLAKQRRLFKKSKVCVIIITKYRRAGACSRRIIKRETAGLPYELERGNCDMVGINNVYL